jgi:hypothetical protein
MPRCGARVGFGDRGIGNATLQKSRGITVSVSEREVAGRNIAVRASALAQRCVSYRQKQANMETSHDPRVLLGRVDAA